jgi:hypothetical protein
LTILPWIMRIGGCVLGKGSRLQFCLVTCPAKRRAWLSAETRALVITRQDNFASHFAKTF